MTRGELLSSTRRWLASRIEEVPPSLTEAVGELLERAAGESGVPPDVHAPAGSVPDFLAYAAICELERIGRDEEHERELAVRLLAADACLTWAFEAAAERGDAGALEELAEANGLRGRIGDLLARIEVEA